LAWAGGDGGSPKPAGPDADPARSPLFSKDRASGARSAIGYDPPMSELDFYEPYAWALERLGQVFGQENVSPLTPTDRGRRLVVEIRNPGGGDRPPYRLLLKDMYVKDLPLIDVDEYPDPATFLEGEIQKARSYFEGKSIYAQTIP
jgi:hypothetical protein